MMKVVVRSMAAILVAFALVACATSTPKTVDDVITTYNVNMAAAHANPSVTVPSSGIGSAVVTLNETKKTVSLTGSYKDLTGPATAAHIHMGAKGSTGGVVAALTITADPAPTISVIGVNSGKLTLEATELSEAQITDMKAGKHYINIHTDKNAPGEVRGQISDVPEDIVIEYTFDLSYANAVPANIAPSTGKGSATVTLNETTKTVVVSGSYADMSAPVTAAHIHGPAAKGATGGVVVGLTVTPDVVPAIAVIEATYSGKLSLAATDLSDDQITDMKAGMHYINVHTSQNPAGEVRGQISNNPADIIVSYVTELSSSNSVPAVKVASSGAGKSVATLNKTTSQVMLIGSYKDLTGPATAAHIHFGAVGATGDVVLPLSVTDTADNVGSGSFGFPATTITAEQIKLMESGQFYINIHTAANPAGEIRGQIQ